MLQDCHPVEMWVQACQISGFSKEPKHLGTLMWKKNPSFTNTVLAKGNAHASDKATGLVVCTLT